MAIGLSGVALENLPDCHIVRVEYEREKQRALIREACDIHLDALRNAFETGSEAAIMAASGPFATLLGFYAVAFKHPAFADEREWRAVTGAAEENTRTRLTAAVVARYVALSLEVAVGEGINLVDVVVSPFLDWEDAKVQIETVLIKHGVPVSLLRQSQAPVRAIGGA